MPDQPGGPPGSGPPLEGTGPPPIEGAARDLAVALTVDGQSLFITLTPNDNDFVSSANVVYSVFYLSPAVYSPNDIYLGTTGGIGFIQGRMKVVDFNGGAGIISTTVPYLPYNIGGWMYATVTPPAIGVNGAAEHALAGTNFVSVPPFNATTDEPLVAEIPTNVLVQSNVLSGSNRQVQFSWKNPGTLTTVSYMKIAFSNYQQDNAYEGIKTLAIYRINTRPGATQGATLYVQGVTQGDSQQSVILETDSPPGHNITWYFIPMTSALVPLRTASCPTAIMVGGIS